MSKRSVTTDALETLGNIIDDKQKRDAIHIAVEPVVAGERLHPGEHVGFDPNEPGVVRVKAGPHVGIVDPFLDEAVEKGERFWLLVYPRQVTSLRHVWEHPAFPASDVLGPGTEDKRASPSPFDYEEADAPYDAPADDQAVSRAWIEAFADQISQSYDDLMEAADDWVRREKYTYDNSERYKEHWDKFAEFWPHWAVVTGREPPEDRASSFFTCMC